MQTWFIVLFLKWCSCFGFIYARGTSHGVAGELTQQGTYSSTGEVVRRGQAPGRLYNEEAVEMRDGPREDWNEAEKSKQSLANAHQLDGNLTAPGSGETYEEGSTSPDPLCAADADPFRDCLPSDVKSLKNIARGTRQHITVCLKFSHGLRCVTDYAERCFPPGTSAFLIPLNKTYAKNCAQLRSGPEILGSDCYAELEPKWRRCVSAFQNLPRLNADGELVVSNELEKPGRMQVTFADDRKKCCDRFRALKCAYDAAKSVGACTPTAIVQTIRATDLLSREYAPTLCLTADPSDCYFPKERAQPSTQVRQQTNSTEGTSLLSSPATSSASSFSGHHTWPGSSFVALLRLPWLHTCNFIFLRSVIGGYWPLAFSAAGGIG